ncbi:response regulator [Sphingomonas endophytica]|uniref:response regulator n=1 Tax=Sphingomonas endophytica TaxID=869719 RepID=UPI000736C7B6|nr:response regulator [Sphingomonas endophytica]
MEDEYFIASDLKRALEAEQVTVVGPVGSVADALRLIDHDGVDIAMLDVNLGTAMCFPVAERLRELGVPFMFLTGYDDWALPDVFRDVPLLPKPFVVGDVLAAVRRLSDSETVQ